MAEQQVETARERLARLMDERRQELGLEWNQVIAAAGLTKTGLNTIRFETRAIRAKSARGIERALNWPTGAIDHVLAGGNPADSPAAALITRHIATPPPQRQRSEPIFDSGVDALIQLDDGRTWAIQAKFTPADSPIEDRLAGALEGAGFEIRQVVVTSPLLDHGVDIANVSGLWLAGSTWLSTAEPGAGRAGRGEQSAEDITTEEILNDPEIPESVRRTLLDGIQRIRRDIAEELRKSS